MTAVSANRQPALQCRSLPKNISDIVAPLILWLIFISYKSAYHI